VLWRKGINVILRNYSINHIDVNVVEDDGFSWRFTHIYCEPKNGIEASYLEIIVCPSRTSIYAMVMRGGF
jgi:hypothetical protein